MGGPFFHFKHVELWKKGKGSFYITFATQTQIQQTLYAFLGFWVQGTQVWHPKQKITNKEVLDALAKANTKKIHNIPQQKIFPLI